MLAPARSLHAMQSMFSRRRQDRRPRVANGYALLSIVGTRQSKLMSPVKIDPVKVREFKDAASFYKWLGKRHDKDDEVWIKIHKVDSGLKSITAKEAIDVVLCWGWIDGLRKGFDNQSFLQRYSPRGKKSVWSQINVDNIARLITEERMTEHGLKHVDAAKADGRWDRAYKAGKD